MLVNQYKKLKFKGKKIEKMQIFGNPIILLDDIGKSRHMDELRDHKIALLHCCNRLEDTLNRS